MHRLDYSLRIEPLCGHGSRGGGLVVGLFQCGQLQGLPRALGGVDVRVLIHGGGLLHQRPMALLLAVQQRQESHDDGEPVHIIRDHRAVRGRIGPAEEGIEDGPTATAGVDLGAATLFVRQWRPVAHEENLLTSTCHTLV